MERRAFIVFQGTPRVFYVSDEPGIDALQEAEEYAADMAEDSPTKWTLMPVNVRDIESALVAVNRGVVMCTLKEAS